MHPHGHYGTPALNARLTDLAARFYLTSSLDSTYVDKRLWINDESLPMGGQLNVSGDWLATTGHVGHQKGIEGDVSDEIVYAGKEDYKLRRLAGAEGFYVYDEVGESGNSHYHLVIQAAPHWWAPFVGPIHAVPGAPTPDYPPLTGQ